MQRGTGKIVIGSIMLAAALFLGLVLPAIQKKLSKARYGTSHRISLEEAEHIFEAGAERLLVGTGHSGCVELSDEAAVVPKIALVLIGITPP